MRKKIIILVIIIVLIVAALLYWFFNRKNEVPVIQQTPTIIEETKPEEPRVLSEQMKEKFLIDTSTEVRILTSEEKEDFGIDTKYDVHEMLDSEKDYVGIPTSTRAFMDILPAEDSQIGSLRRIYFCETEACK